MLNISKNSFDGIILGSQKSDLPQGVLENSKYSLEFDKEHKISADAKLLTVSTTDEVEEFVLNGQVIDIKNIENFIKEENPLVELSDDGIFYTFPKYNLSLFIDTDNKVFLQILIYDESIRYLYENEKMLTYADALHKKSLHLQTENLILIPYKSIGEFQFNSSFEIFIKKYNLTLKTPPENKEIIELDNCFFRFDNGLLTQVSIRNNKKKNISIYYKEFEVSTRKGLNYLLKEENVIERTSSKYLFPDLGLVIEKDLSEFHFFNEVLLKFWANVHRPITSW